MIYADKLEQANAMLETGIKPKAIAKVIGINDQQIYKLLKRMKPNRLRITWKAARSEAIWLLISLGISAAEIAKLYGVHRSQIGRWATMRSGGNPLIRIALCDSVQSATDEPIKAGAYYVHRGATPLEVCLVSADDTSQRLYFIPAVRLQGKVKVVSLSGSKING